MSDAIEQLGVKVLPDGRMDRANAARYLGLSVQTLAVWSMRKTGPRPIRVGGRVFYRKADIDRFIASRVLAAESKPAWWPSAEGGEAA